jgi:D-sedoheptulose 7-phosphate isomerase
MIPNNQPTDIPQYFARLADTIARLPLDSIGELERELLRAYRDGRTVFTLGNGGSAATASHIVCDINKGITSPQLQKRFRVIALTDNVPSITAWANDCSYESIFSEQLLNLGAERDVVFAISGSGNSPNVLKALTVARDLNAITLGLAGFDGGRMRSLCDFCVVVPSYNMQIVEDLHHSIMHSLFTSIRAQLQPRAAAARA